VVKKQEDSDEDKENDDDESDEQSEDDEWVSCKYWPYFVLNKSIIMTKTLFMLDMFASQWIFLPYTVVPQSWSFNMQLFF
jgi:hypothetical protein